MDVELCYYLCMEIKYKIQELLGKQISVFDLKGIGACNNAYYVETIDGSKYIVKEERAVKEFLPENSLIVESAVAKKLYEAGLSVSVPHVIFVTEHPEMYGYEYVEGNLMKNVWGFLNEEERIHICNSLGLFHAEIGQKITKEASVACGVKINDSRGFHPEIIKDYDRLVVDSNVPDEFKELVKKAKKIFDGTSNMAVFQFIHNDAHHENILIKDKVISGIIDFGEAEYGEMAKEFSRYIRDYPDYFQYIVSAYEDRSGNKLYYERLVTNALISGFVDIVENYWKGGEKKIQAEKAIEKYKLLIDVEYQSVLTDLILWAESIIGTRFTATKEIHGDEGEVYKLSNDIDIYFLKLKKNSDFSKESARLEWLKDKLPVPRVLGCTVMKGICAMLISAIKGKNLKVLSQEWPPEKVIEKLADVLHRFHNTDTTGWPFDLSDSEKILVHGGACLPNFIFTDNSFSGYVDLGEVQLGNVETDLGAAIWSLQFNLGHGYGQKFLEKYGYSDTSEENI